MSRTACYLVRRLAWEGGYSYPIFESNSDQGSYDDTTGPRHLPVALCQTEREAKAEAHRRNMEARLSRNPFWFSDTWNDLTDLKLDEAAARLVRKDLAPPPARHPDDTGDYLWRTCESWRGWWDRESVNWTAEQLADAWAAFPKLRFYDVVEIEVED